MLDETKKAIEEWHRRRKKRLSERTRMDVEPGETADETGGAKVFHGNTRIPFGLCASAGIDTTGMTPHDAWEALKGEGVTPEKAYKALKEHGTVSGLSKEKPIVPKHEAKSSGISHKVSQAIKELESKEGAAPEIKEALNKIVAEMGTDAYVGFVSPSGKVFKYPAGSAEALSQIAYYKSMGIDVIAGSNEADADERMKALLESWKTSDNLRNMVRLAEVEKTILDEKRLSGEITKEEYQEQIRNINENRNKRILKARPTFDSCSNAKEVAIRMEASGCYEQKAEFANDSDLDTLKEVATSAEKMFSVFPTMKKRVRNINTRKTMDNAYAWVKSEPGTSIYISNPYAKDRKMLVYTYAKEVKRHHHPKGTDTRAIVYHEFAHVIDITLSKYIQNRGDLPKHGKGAFISTVILNEISAKLGAPEDEIKLSVSKYAAHKYEDSEKFDDMDFLAECMGEYFGSEHPREVATECANILFGYMRKYWGDKAVNISAI